MYIYRCIHNLYIHYIIEFYKIYVTSNISAIAASLRLKSDIVALVKMVVDNLEQCYSHCGFVISSAPCLIIVGSMLPALTLKVFCFW